MLLYDDYDDDVDDDRGLLLLVGLGRSRFENGKTPAVLMNVSATKMRDQGKVPIVVEKQIILQSSKGFLLLSIRTVNI